MYMKDTAFKEIEPFLCLALSVISLVAAMDDTSDKNCSAAEMEPQPYRK